MKPPFTLTAPTKATAPRCIPCQSTGEVECDDCDGYGGCSCGRRGADPECGVCDGSGRTDCPHCLGLGDATVAADLRNEAMAPFLPAAVQKAIGHVATALLLSPWLTIHGTLVVVGRFTTRQRRTLKAGKLACDDEGKHGHGERWRWRPSPDTAKDYAATLKKLVKTAAAEIEEREL